MRPKTVIRDMSEWREIAYSVETRWETLPSPQRLGTLFRERVQRLEALSPKDLGPPCHSIQHKTNPLNR
ncbi:MAG: hypothetical protein ACREX4_25180 [Gammaproteobacteria bacterium]